MLKILIILFFLIHVVASTSLNPPDNISQSIDFYRDNDVIYNNDVKAEQMGESDIDDVDEVYRDNDVIYNNDVKAEQMRMGRFRWYCNRCMRSGRGYRCNRCRRSGGRGGGGRRGGGRRGGGRRGGGRRGGRE
ncbi:10749_t:CDS:1 [Racocetra persica]|uniref:10749_t:CDS:1 n=1 Tax=Racocetra persica TaxID=160502 RepID=A0ACA9LT36_9GLOM|nr:10749_t:CDS:1 [Racocetra persica]